MKHKVSELEGELLDRAVHKALLASGETTFMTRNGEYPLPLDRHPSFEMEWVSFCSEWEYGGPIIERENFDFEFDFDEPADRQCIAFIHDRKRPVRGHKGCHTEVSRARGPGHLVAAMRAYVRLKLGDEVDL
jgi:hypothetical protein